MMYPLPRRYAALTGRRMDFWDAVYYLAHRGGGRAVVSSRELADLTGLHRKKITPLLNAALEGEKLCRDVPLETPGPWHFELIIPDYHAETAVILKPLGYVANGWLQVVQPSLPKRLLNHLLDRAGSGDGTIPLDPGAAALAMRRTGASTPVAYRRVQDALDTLICLELVQPLAEDCLRLNLSRFEMPAPVDASPEEERDGYRQAHAVDPLRAQRARALIHSGNLPFERDFERVFRRLADPVISADLGRLQETLRSARHLPPDRRWDWVMGQLARRPGPPESDLWPALRRRAWSHIHPALESLKREKYRPAVYTPRPTADRAFGHFCRGRRPALALIGPAGVGKSSTLAHWAEEMLDRGQAALFYLAPTLLPAANGLLDRVARDLGFSTPATLFSCLSHPDRRLYVFIDALNEAPDPLGLSATLNRAFQVVAAESPRPPLRFIVSCRQGTWKRLARRGLPYPTLLYDGAPVALGPFDEQELADAFALYQTHYSLQNGLGRLSPALRKLLRMPLFLGLVADAYRTRPLPVVDLGPQVIERYLEQKLPNPLHLLLLRRIVALMAETQSLALPLARLWEDPVVAPLLSHEGHAAPYSHLLSEGLIQESVTPHSDVEIRFTYERIFEHLLGQVTLPDSLRRDVLVALLDEGAAFPSLRNAAVSRLGTHVSLPLMERLAADPDPGLRGLARDALILHYEHDSVEVKGCLDRLMRRANADAVHTGLAVALERRLLAPILTATAHPDRLAREQGVLYAYYLWRRDQERGWALLEKLARRAVGRFGLPRRRSLETLLQTSILIIVNHLSPGQADQLQPLIALWQRLLRRVPLIGGRSSLAARARSILVSVGERALVSMLESISLNQTVPKGRGVAHTYFEALYSLPAQDKQFLLQRLDALDPEQASIAEPATAQALLDLARKGPDSWLVWIMAGDALASHHRHEPQATKALIRRMLESTEDTVYWCAVSGAGAIAEQGQPNSHKELAISIRNRLARWERERADTENAFFFFARTMMAELRAGRPDPTLSQRLLEPEWTHDDPRAVVIVLYSLEGLAYLGYPLPALRALGRHFHDGRAPVRAALEEILRRLAVLYPDDVYFFLEEAPSELKETLQAGKPPAVLWQLIGRRAQDAWPLLFSISPTRRFMLDLLRQTLCCPDWAAARRLVIERLIEFLLD